VWYNGGIIMRMEKQKFSKKYLLKRYFVHQKSHKDSHTVFSKVDFFISDVKGEASM
jgi:hypothetical protein